MRYNSKWLELGWSLMSLFYSSMATIQVLTFYTCAVGCEVVWSVFSM